MMRSGLSMKRATTPSSPHPLRKRMTAERGATKMPRCVALPEPDPEPRYRGGHCNPCRSVRRLILFDTPRHLIAIFRKFRLFSVACLLNRDAADRAYSPSANYTRLLVRNLQ